MEQYNVTGMICAACSARVEKAVAKLPGVSSCSVSLLTNSMGVEGTASEREIIAAVEEAGYGASKKGAEKTSGTTANPEEALAAITVNAARIAGLDETLGSLSPGREADIVIADRHPLELLGKVKAVLMGGRRI